MTEHAAAAPPHGEPHAEQHGGDHGHDDSPEAIAREKRKYLIIFGILGILTVFTVLANRLHVPHSVAIVIALTIAVVKGSLVAAFFMHLISERRLIYAVLVLTVFFFAVLLWGPWHHHYNTFGNDLHNQAGGQDTTHSTTKTH